MSRFSLTPEITADDLIEFDIFTNLDKSLTDTQIPLSQIEASDAVINLALRTIEWRGYQYESNSEMLIGYGTSDSADNIGHTEKDSYNSFIGKWKDIERKYKRLLPVQTMSQTQYDSLLSLYFFTGDFKFIGTGSYKLYIGDYIKNRQWQYIATAMIRTNHQRNLRRQEANILMLADYGRYKDRALLKDNGLQDIRKRYPELLSPTQQRQAEYVYYAETKRFLPKMSQSRMRQVVKLYEQNN